MTVTAIKDSGRICAYMPLFNISHKLTCVIWLVIRVGDMGSKGSVNHEETFIGQMSDEASRDESLGEGFSDSKTSKVQLGSCLSVRECHYSMLYLVHILSMTEEGSVSHDECAAAYC